MIIASFPNRFFIPDGVNDVHTWSCISKPVAFSIEDVLVAYGMEVGETAGEFDFFVVYGNTFVGCLGPDSFLLGINSTSAPAGRVHGDRVSRSKV